MSAPAWDDTAFTRWNDIPTENPPAVLQALGGEWIPVIFPLTTQQVTNALPSLVLVTGGVLHDSERGPRRMGAKTTGAGAL